MNTRLVFECISVLLISCFPSVTPETESKRLLFNDPDVITRLSNVEKEMSQLKTELADEKLKNANLRQTLQNFSGSGSVYIRWGRTSCQGPSTKLVYKGYAAGERYYHTVSKAYYGGPANFLCLPEDPKLSNDTFSFTNSLINGVELEKSFQSSALNQDIPCAVCKTSLPTTIMIPGRQSCYSGWNTEYKGVVASGYVGHSPSSYICVDRNFEYIASGQGNQGGRELYTVGYKCGPLTDYRY